MGKELGEAGRKMGEAFGRMGRTWGEEAGKAGKGLGSWWYGSLGIAAPFVLGLIGVVALLVGMVIIGAIATFSEHEDLWNDLISFVWQYFWVFVGLIFLNAFSNYFHRMYRRSWRWISPVATAVGSVASFWMLAQVLEIMDRDLGHPTLGNLSDLIELLLPAIFFLVIVFGYLLAFFVTIGERGDEPPRYGRNSPR